MSTRELFTAALEHHRAGRLFEAEALYRRILAQETEHPDSLHMLGVIAQQSGQPALAIELIRRAIAHNSTVPAFHNNLGNAYVATQKWLEAETCFRRALEWKPDHAEAHYNLGTALCAQGRLEDAEASYQQALKYRPDHAETHLNLGNVLRAQGKLEAAAEAYQRAVVLKPTLAVGHNNLGNLYAAQERFDAALSAYARAIELKPNFAEAWRNRGLANLRLGRPQEAAAACRQAIRFKPDYAAAYLILAGALRDLGYKEDAELTYQRAVTLDPDAADARLGWAVAAVPLIPEAITEAVRATEHFLARLDTLTQWSRANPGKLGEAVGTVQPFHLAYRPVDVTAALSRYGELISAEATAFWRPPPPIPVPGREKIRLAVVTGQIKQHPVWEVILRGLIQHLDPGRFEIFLYHTGSVENEQTAWARERVASFVHGPKPVRQWLAEITGAQPDALLYPEVGMDPTTCTLAALRLAPLQIASWGHPVTTGLPTIDWFVSAEFMESPQAQQHYRETLITLPGTGVCTEFTEVERESWGGPARTDGVARFALCQQPLKFDPEHDNMLARLAKTVGRCEFWLATPANMPWSATKLQTRLAAAFQAEGLDPEGYLRATPWLPRRQFSSFLDEMDIYLDCPAFSGYTTAWQALHCGLPVITLEGPFLRQRLAAGLLRQAGLTDGITRTTAEYLATAARWASECRDTDFWTTRRAEVRALAARVDGQRAAVSALEQHLWKALRT